jgi:hypothetical protein
LVRSIRQVGASTARKLLHRAGILNDRARLVDLTERQRTMLAGALLAEAGDN